MFDEHKGGEICVLFNCASQGEKAEELLLSSFRHSLLPTKDKSFSRLKTCC